MNFLALSLRMAASQGGNVYLPYTFDGKWTQEEKDKVKQIADKHMPAQVDSMYNNMLFYKHGYGFYARRATWDNGGLGAKTVDEFCQKLEKYFDN